MARRVPIYVCQSCGATHPKWAGRCDACGGWNTLVEETAAAGRRARSGSSLPLVALSGAPLATERWTGGIAEFDRVVGGGLVRGSALLIGGDPGIGKSTLVLQLAAALGDRMQAVYVSGEEAVDQVRMRAQRLGLGDRRVQLAAGTDVGEIIATLEGIPGDALVIIDSIQTLHLDALESAPGTVAQVRASAQALIRFAKRQGAVLLLVGHVTKEGLIAGPRVLEHMVDTVLYFEGERGHQFRILRAVKNRFGPTDEIGVFEMTGAGLAEVANPSLLFLGERDAEVTGAAVFAGIEGTRPMLVEIQALAAPSPLGIPRRAVVGWDANRLAMVIAVLETRCGLALRAADVYLNVAGGLRISEPAADLAVAAALVSAIADRAVPAESVFCGEIGLAGEIRPVPQIEARLREAEKLGFRKALIPRRGSGRPLPATSLEIHELGHLSELVDRIRRQPRKEAADA